MRIAIVRRRRASSAALPRRRASPIHALPPIVCLLVALATPAAARWATIEDANAVSEYDNYDVTIGASGAWRYVRSSMLEVRNEDGRTNYGTSILKYNARTSKISQIEAETVNPNGRHPVAPEYIENKPLASGADGFDDTYQLTIAYPKVEIGSKLYLKYVKETTEVPIANHYSEEFYFGTETYDKASLIQIKSALPLYLEKNDPEGKLEISHEEKDGEYLATIRLAKPVYTKAIDEDEISVSHFAETWVVVSTSKSYADLAIPVTPTYEAIINSPLPAAFERILGAAKKEKNVIDQINVTTALLADAVRYMGDWRPTKGGHLPRPLDVIASTKFGDCKDFTVATAAILRRLGIEAKAAWVERNNQPTPLPSLALDNAFNHAIVWVKLPDRVLWVDPTNFTSFAQGIFDDIDDRPALVIDGASSRLLNIPAGSPSDSKILKKLDITLDDDGESVIDGTIEYTGRAAAAMAGLSRELSTMSIDHQISRALAEDNAVSWAEVEPYDLSSRITRDIHLGARVGVRNLYFRTTAGNAYQLSPGPLATLLDLETEERVSDLFLGPPELDETHYTLDKVNLVGRPLTGCEIDSPWVKASRKLTHRNHQITIVDRREIKKPLISNAELKGASFRAFQTKLQDCFDRVAIVYR